SHAPSINSKAFPMPGHTYPSLEHALPSIAGALSAVQLLGTIGARTATTRCDTALWSLLRPAESEAHLMPYHDRRDAGRVLATYLTAYAHRTDVLVFGLPRGGMPVAFEVAQALDAPLDVFLVRKLGVPGHEELAMGAIASGGVRVPNEYVLRQLEISSAL